MPEKNYRPGQTVYRGKIATVVFSALPNDAGFAVLFDHKKTQWVKSEEKARRLADGGKA